MNNPDPNFTDYHFGRPVSRRSLRRHQQPSWMVVGKHRRQHRKLGDEWTYRYKDAHRCTMKVTEMAPNKKVVWLVVDNYFNFTEDKTEWTNTKVVFEISTHGNKTEIRFTHQGLVPAYECFDVCSNAWGSYVNGSLRNLIATGKGQPNPKEPNGN